MTLTIELTPDIENSLQEEAGRRGMNPMECARKLIEETLPPEANEANAILHEIEAEQDLRRKNQLARSLLRSWREEGDESEQSNTFQALKEGLNAHHSSERTIYP